MAACQRLLIAAAAVALFALPYLRRAVVGTSCNAHASVVVANAAANSQCAAAGFAIRSGVHSVRGGIWKPRLDASGQLDLQLTTRGATDTSRATLRRARAATATDCSALATDAALARHTLVKAVQTADAQTGLSLYETIDAARDAASTSQAMRSLSRFVPALFGRVGRLKGRPVLLLEDVTAPFRCASWLESKLVDNSTELHMQVAHSPETCTERLRLYNRSAEPLRAAALPRERTAARALARYARLELERLAAAMRAESDLCFHDASVVVVYEGCPRAGEPMRAAVHLLDLDKLLSCSEVRKALATCDCGPEKRARKYRYLSHFARACTYCEVGTAMWLQNLARQFEGLELEL